MRVLLSSNPYRDRGLRVALEARRILNNAGAETALCLPFAPRKGDRLDLPRQVKLGSMEEELKRADVLLCFGGDGTILHAARDATLHDVPILGVNMGSVGFMAELERGELSLLTLLAYLPFLPGILAQVNSVAQFYSVLSSLIPATGLALLINLPLTLWLTPYRTAAEALFYRSILEGRPAAPETEAQS